MHAIPFEDGRFKLIYGANVFEYAYDLRKVVAEMSRVLARPGFAACFCRTNRTRFPSATGRSDVGSLEAVLNLFYKTPHTVLAQDKGLTRNPDAIGNFPSFVVRLDGSAEIN